MTWLLFLKRWWKPLAIVLVLLTTHALAAGFAYSYAKLAYTAVLEAERLTIANDARAQIEAAQKQAYEADERYRKAQQKIPQTGQKVADAVREHPTSPDCVIPDAAADALQDGIDAGKASSAG